MLYHLHRYIACLWWHNCQKNVKRLRYLREDRSLLMYDLLQEHSQKGMTDYG